LRKADDFKDKKRKQDQIDYVLQERSVRESRLQLDVCETGGTNLRDPRQVAEVDLEKLIMSNNKLYMQQKENLINPLSTSVTFR
jgi:hypothetical protein